MSNKNKKQQLANKLRPYKYPRFGEYVLPKVRYKGILRHPIA